MGIPNFSIRGKVTIITGASGGVGKAISLSFAESGAPVVLAARRAALLQAIADEIKAKGGKALAVPTDITNRVQVSEMVQRALKVSTNSKGPSVPLLQGLLPNSSLKAKQAVRWPKIRIWLGYPRPLRQQPLLTRYKTEHKDEMRYLGLEP